MLRCPHCGHDHDAGLSNLAVGDKRLTWKEAAEHYRQQAQDAGEFKRLLLDLDRCEHGRHEGDVCSGCGGPSRGNPVIRDGHLGFDLSGRRIAVPSRADLGDPEAWVIRGATS